VRITVLAMEKRRIARLRVERLTEWPRPPVEPGPCPAAVEKPSMGGPTQHDPQPWRARFLSWMVAVLSTIGLLMGLYVAWRLFWPLRMPIG
jgi:hypothetical protein